MARAARMVPYFFILSLFILLPFKSFAADEAAAAPSDSAAASADIAPVADDATVAPTPDDTAVSADDSKLSTDDTKTDDSADAEKDASAADGGAQTNSLMGGSGGTSTSGQSMNEVYSGQADAFSKIDEQTGAFTYSYPLEVPAGRNGMQPDLQLQYSSSATQDGSFVGYGWNLSIPTVERLNKNGLSGLYSATTFTSSLAGGELVPDVVDGSGYGTYLPRRATPGYVKFNYLSTGSWTATDPNGRVYTFGVVSTDRLADPANSAHVFRWYLESVVDPNGNGVKYTYTTISGQIYPNTVNYTTNGANGGYYTVTFLYEDRPDVTTNSSTGFQVTTTKRMYRVEVKVNSILRKKFVLAYTSGINSTRSLLSTVTTTGYDLAGVASTLPPFVLSYTHDAWDYENVTHTEVPNPASNFGSIRFADVNGDSYVDAVSSFQKNDDTGTYGNYFTGQVSINDHGTWVEDTSWSVPVPFVVDQNNYFDQCTQLVDVNGDDLADIVYKNRHVVAKIGGGTYQQGVYINTGSGWSWDSTWTVPEDICAQDQDLGIRFVDLDGNGLVDIVKSKEDWADPVNQTGIILDQKIYINNGHGWDLSTAWQMPPMGFVVVNGWDTGTKIVDMNADGLPDLVQVLEKDNDNNPNVFDTGTAYLDEGVYLNTGSGWTLSTGWNLPSAVAGGSDEKFIFAHDWHSCTACGNDEQTSQFADLNGDGLPDLFDYINPDSYGEEGIDVYRNTGKTLTEDLTIQLPGSLSWYGVPNTTILLDLNADRIVDYFTEDNLHTGGIQANITRGTTGVQRDEVYAIPRDLLETITLPTSGTIKVAYNASARYDDASGDPLNPDMRFSLTTVDELTFDNGLGAVGTYSYEYAGGKVYYDSSVPTDKKFAGFHRITMTRPDGGKDVRYYQQDDGVDSSTYEDTDSWTKIGHIYREETYNATGGLMTVMNSSWDDFAVGTSGLASFLAPTWEMDMTYDGNSDHKDTVVRYTYDAPTGNLTNVLDLGEVTGNLDGSYTDINSDSITHQYVYAVQTGGAIRNAVQTEYTKDNALSTKKQTRYYYDGATTLGTVVKGNVTKQSEWITGSTYEDTTYVYDSTYAIVTSSTDPIGAVTTFTNDTQKLFPLTVSNDFSQATTYTYDYATGKVLTATDPNGGVQQTTYDGLGRPLHVQQSIIGSSGVEDSAVYSYTTSSFPNTIKKVDWLDGSISVVHYAYVDGFGRTIQTRDEHETAGYSVTDTIYDGLGHVLKQSLPYFSTGTAYTTPTTDTTLYETYTYDSLDRVLTVVNAAGTTSSAYDQWGVTETDPDGKVKIYTYDPHQQLKTVTENIAGLAKVTTYSYSTIGNLTKYVDSAGNLRNFTYDGRGQRLTAQDLHASADTQYGSWSFTFDKVGEVLTTTDANGKIITNTYDHLHRLLTEDDPATTGTDVTYTYDTCTNGVGRLCSVTTLTGVTNSYLYDVLGRVTSTTQTVDSTARTTTYTYNRQGNVLIQTHPDGTKNEYTYGTAGRSSNVKWRNAAGTTSTLLSSATYAPTGAPATVTLGNGVVTTYTYDATKLYRLSNKKSVKSAAELQDLSYTYDAVGNITGIADDPTIYAHVDTAMTYDDVHRLLTSNATSTDSHFTGNRTYTYNALGDILTSPAGSYGYNSTGTGVYSNPHAPTSLTGFTYTYDKNGNQLTDGTWTNVWDFKNRMLSSAKTGNTVSYVYDYQGNRVKKTDTLAAVPTYYVTPEYEIEGAETRHNVNAPGIGPIATMMVNASGASTRYHLTDHLGGTHVEVDYLGNAIQYMVYEPYGKVRYNYQVGSYTNDYKYTGKEQDAETGWQYYGARYYDENRGQFMSEDPVFLALGGEQYIRNGLEHNLNALLKNPQAFNSYSYAGDNPFIHVDPDGKFFLLDDAAAIIIGGGLSVAMQGIQAAVSGERLTAGTIVGAFVTGAIVGEGIVNAPETGGASAVAAAAVVGGVASAVGNVTKQSIDMASGAQQKGFDVGETATFAVFGAVVAGATEGFVPDMSVAGVSTGRNSMRAIGKAAQTKIANGTIAGTTLNTAVKASVGAQTEEGYRTGVGFIADIGRSLFSGWGRNKSKSK